MQQLYATIGKITLEKLTSIQSKMKDNTATAEDRQFEALLLEITALAKNRLCSNSKRNRVQQREVGMGRAHGANTLPPYKAARRCARR